MDCRPWKKEIATTAIESGADVLVPEESGKGKELGRIKTVAADGDLVPERDVFVCRINSKESEQKAVELSRLGYVVIETEDWNVIPLENLVSVSDSIIACGQGFGICRTRPERAREGRQGRIAFYGRPFGNQVSCLPDLIAV